MTYVSKKPLPKETQNRLDKRFVRTVTNLRTVSDGTNFISELLTESEQIMLAKRLMIIFMLTEGVSQYRIKQLLYVSSATVFRMAIALDKNKYEYLKRLCGKKKSRKIFWDELEVIVRLGMPSMGKDRWNWLNELYK